MCDGSRKQKSLGGLKSKNSLEPKVLKFHGLSSPEDLIHLQSITIVDRVGHILLTAYGSELLKIPQDTHIV